MTRPQPIKRATTRFRGWFWQIALVLSYSVRNARIGSMREARQAGISAAHRPTNVSAHPTVTKLRRSTTGIPAGNAFPSGWRINDARAAPVTVPTHAI